MAPCRRKRRERKGAGCAKQVADWLIFFHMQFRVETAEFKLRLRLRTHLTSAFLATVLFHCFRLSPFSHPILTPSLNLERLWKMRFGTAATYAAFAGYIGAGLAHNIALKAHTRECFHEELHKDDKMTVTFQVGDREFGGAGNLEIDFYVCSLGLLPAI